MGKRERETRGPQLLEDVAFPVFYLTVIVIVISLRVIFPFTPSFTLRLFSPAILLIMLWVTGWSADSRYISSPGVWVVVISKINITRAIWYEFGQ